MNKPFQNFIETINFIYPKEIATEDEIKAYKNLRNRNPNESRKKNKRESSTSEKESSSSSITLSEIGPRARNKILFSSDDNEKKKEKLRFGQHENFSFFESFSREIIFQIFNYHPMFFFNYDVTYLEKTDDNNQIDKEGNDIKEKEPNEKNFEIKIIKKDEEKKQVQEEEDKKDTQNKEKNLEEKKDELKVSIKSEQEKKKDINDKEKSKSDDDKKIKNKKKKNKDKFKSDNDKKNKNKNKAKNKPFFKGDIDILIPDVKPEFLDKILHKKELAPFIFFNNIKFDLNSDIIGEIKESVSSGDEKHIEQLNKYRKIIKRCEKDDVLCYKLGLKKQNQKILLYVFNSDYKVYLQRMLIYSPLSIKFKELNDNSSQVNDLCDLYSKSYMNEKHTKKRTYDFIGEIINSQDPYIFIFIQNILTLYSNINKTGKEKRNNLFENEQLSDNINQKEKYVKDKSGKNNESEQEDKKTDNKIIEINTTNDNKNKKIKEVDSSEKEEQEVKNMDKKAIKKSDILIDGEKKQQDNLNRRINEPNINMEKAIVNDITKIISPINKIKDMFYYLIFILLCNLVLILIIFIKIIFFLK